MNTAMGNVLIMCACMYSLVRELGVHARLINNGDDCCLIVERADLDRVQGRITPFFDQLGFIIDVEGVSSTLEGISFCQTNPVTTGTRCVMVRNPNVAISKDCTILKGWSRKEYAVYLRELGIAGLAAYGDIPVWGSFYRCLSRSVVVGKVSDGLRAHVNQSIVESGLGRLAHGSSCGTIITPEARANFALAFGIAPSVQLALEEYYDRMMPGTGEVYPGFALSKLF